MDTKRSGRQARQIERAKKGSGMGRPYILRNIPTYDVLSEENLLRIEAAADRVLAETGIEFRDDPATLDHWRRAGAQVDGLLVKFPPGMLREILAVMRAQHIAVIDLPGYPARTLARTVRWLPDALLQMLLAKRFARGRGDKRPSFYYDVVNPNPAQHSEVEWLNGAVVRAGAACGVPTPVNAVLRQVLMDIVSGQADPSKWRGNAVALLDKVAKENAS